MHGHCADRTHSRPYRSWSSMCARARHGGVDVDPAWLASFARFLDDLGEPPMPKRGHYVRLERQDRGAEHGPDNSAWTMRPIPRRRRRRRPKTGYRNGCSAREMAANGSKRVTGTSDNPRHRVPGGSDGYA